jgi:hypothetical protein
MSMAAAYRRARLSEIGISLSDFVADPIGAIERAVDTDVFDRWAPFQLVSATALRALVEDVQSSDAARAFGVAGHQSFARQLQILGVTGKQLDSLPKGARHADR